MVLIHQITSGPLETHTYIVYTEREKLAAIIDPSYGCFSAVKSFLEAQAARLSQIWLTHSHWDHIADCRIFQEQYSWESEILPLHVHTLDHENVLRPGSDGLPLYFPIQGAQPTRLFRHEEALLLGSEEFTVYHTPGHSPGSSCFFHQPSNTLFTGDTLFKGTWGNVSFPTSSQEAMRDSLKFLSNFEEGDSPITIYPGHGARTTLAEEKKWLKRIFQKR